MGDDFKRLFGKDPPANPNAANTKPDKPGAAPDAKKPNPPSSQADKHGHGQPQDKHEKTPEKHGHPPDKHDKSHDKHDKPSDKHDKPPEKPGKAPDKPGPPLPATHGSSPVPAPPGPQAAYPDQYGQAPYPDQYGPAPYPEDPYGQEFYGPEYYPSDYQYGAAPYPDPYGQIPPGSDMDFGSLIEPSASMMTMPQAPPPADTKNKKTEGGKTKEEKTQKHSGPEHEHVTLAKRFPLLIIILVIMVASAIGTSVWSILQNRFGYPPTTFSEEASTNTFAALLSLFLNCLFSIIILRGKIRNLVLGYLISFHFVVTFYFCLKGASRAIISIKYDDIATIEEYVFSRYNNQSQGELPHFFHRLQTHFQCCGTNTVDKMIDWPERLQTDNMPRSCCKKLTYTCGEKLARTRTYKGGPKQPMRIPSGYFLTLTESEMDRIVQSGKPVRIVRPPGADSGMSTVLRVIRDFYFESLRKGNLPDTPLDQIKRIPTDIVEPEDVGEAYLPTAVGCRDDSSLEKITTIGWQIQQMLDFETSILYKGSASANAYEWMAWKIPMCKELAGQAPFHLASNYNREIKDLRADIKHMWYISRGITENYILKGLLWELYCEHEKNLELLPDLPFVSVLLGERRNPKGSKVIGNFYISFVRKLMVQCVAMSVVVAVLLFIVFLIFWKYYSRMKLEEYANLPFDPEFEALKVRHRDLYEQHNKAEYDKDKYKDLPPDEEDETDLPEEDHVLQADIYQEYENLFGPPAPPSPSNFPPVENVSSIAFPAP